MARKTTKRKKTTTKKAPVAKTVTEETTTAESLAESVEAAEMSTMSEETKTPEATDTPSVDDTAPDADNLIKVMGKRELIDRVVATSGIKKKSAKPVVEAVLKELGDALHRGENLNLQPFGKGIVKTRKELENAEIVELRLRRSKLAITAAEAAFDGSNDSDDDAPIAEAAE